MRDQSGANIIVDFHNWVRSVPLEQYQYVVIMSGQTMRLLNICRENDPRLCSQYLTENGLMLQTETIAKTYENSKRFPKIAVVDGFMVYGRNMNLFLSKLWNLVWSLLACRSIDKDEKSLRAEFAESVSLWIYALNNTHLLLHPEFQWGLHRHLLLPDGELRSLAKSTHGVIVQESVASEAYIISARFPENHPGYQPDPSFWNVSNSVQYKKDGQNFELFLFAPVVAPGVYPCVQSTRNHGVMYYTPYFFMPELDWTQMLRVLNIVFKMSGEQDQRTTNKCIYLLNRIKKYKSRMEIYAQFAILLLSQIVLSVFFEGLDPQFETIYDISLPSRNFGFPEDMKPILDKFCQIRWSRQQLEEVLGCFGELNGEEGMASLPANGQEIVCETQKIVYKQAADHESEAAARQHYLDHTPSNSLVNKMGEQELYQIISRIKKSANVHMDADAAPTILSSLTQMIGLGDVSLRVRARCCDGLPKFFFAIRTTETTLSIMPELLGGYYPHFRLLARLYWRDDDFPDRVERYFRDDVFAGDSDGRHTRLIGEAKYFAQIVIEHRNVLGSILDWKDNANADAF